MGNAQRLSALDAAFVKLDALGAPYHVAAVLVFRGQPDVAAIRAFLASALDRLPRYRQRLDRVPLLGHPVWRDDEAFDVGRHLDVLSVEPPGTPAQLDALVGEILSRDLEPGRPPWHLWLVDGLAQGAEFALVAKVHHSLVDGIAGVHLLTEMLRGTPDPTVPARLPWRPEIPSRRRLLGAELAHRLRGVRALRHNLPGSARELVPALAKLVAHGLRPAAEAGINPRQLGRGRLLVRTQLDMAELRAIKRRTDSTINDVVLAVVAGALRRFLLRRGLDVGRLRDFRAMVPASTHAKDDAASTGNRVALLLVELPIAEPDARRRLELVRERSRALKTRAHEAAAGELLVRVADVTVPRLLPAILGLSLRQRGFNVVVTNIPGPPFPLFLLGAPLARFHAIVNLWPRQALGVALVSYLGTMHVAVQAARDHVPDLADFAGDLERSFAELAALAPVAHDAPREASAPASP